MRISVKTSLSAVVGVLVAFLLIQSGLGASQLRTMQSSAAQVTGEALPTLRRIAEIEQAITHHRLQVASLVLDEDPTASQAIDEAIVVSSKRIDGLFRAHEAMDLDVEEKKLWGEFRGLWDENVKALNEALSLKRLTDRSGAASALARSVPGFDRTLKVLDGAIASAVGHADRESANIEEAYVSSLTRTIVLAGIGVVIGLGAAAFVVFGITAPLRALTGVMQAIAAGRLDTSIPSVKRPNEIGDMARTLVVFRDGLAEAEALRADRAAEERAVVERMAKERREIADRFMATMGTLAQRFVRSSSDVAGAARDLSATAEETSRQVTTVSTAAGEAAANVQTVAASTEELAASVREITGRVGQSAEVAQAAATEAANTEANIRLLSEAAEKIGDVVELIRDIAGQTNLLALNATIEAARAGEAGKGFAVVASEVKQLASQTAKATDEIALKIGEIQSATAETVVSISSIVGTIGSIREATSSIAGAVTQQGAAAAEISSNTHRAALGAQQVTETISGVGRAAETTGTAAGRLMGLSSELSGQADELTRQVESFVSTLRAA
ncbi:MAG: methyl-accepting chemotaxis protein [Siculibacillus sp.]|nr:methyl-accepting chemotaxis protein [Siculibacillus sp.]